MLPVNVCVFVCARSMWVCLCGLCVCVLGQLCVFVCARLVSVCLCVLGMECLQCGGDGGGGKATLLPTLGCLVSLSPLLSVGLRLHPLPAALVSRA